MTESEDETAPSEEIPIKKTKSYFISSFVIILVFVGTSYLGYFLKILDLNYFIAITLLFFTLTGIIIGLSDRLETVQVEKWGNKFRKFSHLFGGVAMITFCVYDVRILSWFSLSFFILFLLHEIFYVKFKKIVICS